jgi:hypothetical protein
MRWCLIVFIDFTFTIAIVTTTTVAAAAAAACDKRRRRQQQLQAASSKQKHRCGASTPRGAVIKRKK